MKINLRFDIPIVFARTRNNKEVVHLHTAFIIAVQQWLHVLQHKASIIKP